MQSNGHGNKTDLDLVSRVAELEASNQGAYIKGAVVLACLIGATILAAVKVIPAEAVCTVYGLALGAVGVQVSNLIPKKKPEE